MRDETLIGPWVRRFLLEHVIIDRNFSRNTQASYRDALVLLLPYISNLQHKSVDRLTVDDAAPVVRSFLEYLEKERGCCGTTRNLRLATIHSLAKFIAVHCPEQVLGYAEIRTVPFKKTAKSTLNYLDKDEMDVLLRTPNLETLQGARQATTPCCCSCTTLELAPIGRALLWLTLPGAILPRCTSLEKAARRVGAPFGNRRPTHSNHWCLDAQRRTSSSSTDWTNR